MRDKLTKKQPSVRGDFLAANPELGKRYAFFSAQQHPARASSEPLRHSKSCSNDDAQCYTQSDLSIFGREKIEEQPISTDRAASDGEEAEEEKSLLDSRSIAKKVGPKAAKALRGVNQIVAPIALVVDSYNFGTSAVKDCQQGTTRNTTTVAAGIAGGWGGAIAGAEVGAAIGAVGGPIGMVVGGLVGGVTGTLGGSWGGETAAEKIGDATDYDIEERKCPICLRVFKARKYQNFEETRCPDCVEQEEPVVKSSSIKSLTE